MKPQTPATQTTKPTTPKKQRPPKPNLTIIAACPTLGQKKGSLKRDCMGLFFKKPFTWGCFFKRPFAWG